jgi:CMP-N,N'-diacetyllegionaminic acid synthase
MKVFCIIPARGGSKGIPNKNIIDFCGRPLLAWSILQAKKASVVEKVYVTSDSSKILRIAEENGAIGIRRPGDLSTDTSPSEEALLHALGDVEKRGDGCPDIVVFLQATSPLREAEDINGSVKKLLTGGFDSLFSMAVLEDFCVWAEQGGKLKGVTFDPMNRGKRQDRKPYYLENGSIYVFRSEILLRSGNRLGGKMSMFEMPFWKSFEIDTIEDIEIAKYFFQKRLLSKFET